MKKFKPFKSFKPFNQLNVLNDLNVCLKKNTGFISSGSAGSA